MNFRRFAILNVLRNKRIYMAHFLSSAFSVMIFFTYALLLFHPDLKGELVSSSGTLSRLGTIGMQVSEVIIFVFSFFFLLYSVGAFLKLRKKEFGILILLGMSRRQLNRMLFVENAWIGFAALAFGIGVGLIFSKLILLASARLLAIEDGLRFYVPLNAVLLTVVAFGVLFLMIASLTSVMAGKERVAELILAEDKPKPEPAASPWLSALAVLLLAGGYGIVLDFAINRHFSFQQLLAGVVLSIAGTYFLFTQTSVYALRALRGKKLFFRRTNMLTLSELTYRMRDNAATFFIVAVVSAVAFTGIGTTLALGDPGLAAMYNPYAYSYSSYSADYSKEPAAVAEIGRALQSAGLPYTVHPMSPLQTETSYTLVKLSEYNRLAADLGYPAEALGGEGEAFLTPSYLWQKEDWEKSGYPEGVGTENGSGANPAPVELVVGGKKADAQIVKYVPRIVLPDVGYAGTLVVTDGLYDRLLKGVTDKTSLSRTYLFDVPDWQKTVGLSKELVDRVNNGGSDDDYLRSLALEWVSSKQENGMLFIVSGLVGIVFFTFAASTIYFRLYADMDRDERQYGMIAKVGLSGKELSRIMTRQLFIMFFVPLLMALVHSSVAFFALQLLVDYSVVAHSLAIFASFVAIQLVYFLIARWRAVEHLRRRLAEPGLTR
ncbi:ABC transporter permease [Paenibacillus sp. MWE-103]|uniref:ABC transporter permease n=1 Tax=Paenibacillus artemisiicola TaxID=1172618 RepID=A0ABS3W4T7_9BACL|nr:ABC transporter permease [Paenibacillus artemisiicola]MBO7743325.1 ABC transporter permease [Paenibacillus artemisiicola]